MDDLVDSLASSFAVSNNPNDPSRPHPRFSLYKGRNEGPSSQEIRRKRTLEIQKKRRDDYMNVARSLVVGNIQDDLSEDDDVIEWMDDSEWRDDQDESHEYRQRRGPSSANKLLKLLDLKTSYRNQLMQSEWMVEVPMTFATDWLAMPVPEGKRNLVIAGDGKTKQFSRSGAFINQFPSLLPGGNRKSGSNNGQVTILDTIFSPISRTFYVLDVMIWSQMPYYGCDTEFRVIPHYACDTKSLDRIFNTDPSFDFDPLPLDGILFYHKRVNYLPGVTPLVGWLKGYMLPEMLNVKVCEKLMKQKPNNYATMTGYIDEYNEMRSQKDDVNGDDKVKEKVHE